MMGGYGDVQMIDENGLRMDGRKPGDVRPITIETGVVPVIDAGLAGKGGVGQIGAGILRAPPECFQLAKDAYSKVYPSEN